MSAGPKAAAVLLKEGPAARRAPRANSAPLAQLASGQTHWRDIDIEQSEVVRPVGLEPTTF